MHQQQAARNQTRHLAGKQKHPLKAEFVKYGRRFKKERDRGRPRDNEHKHQTHQESQKQTLPVRQHFGVALVCAGLHIRWLIYILLGVDYPSHKII